MRSLKIALIVIIILAGGFFSQALAWEPGYVEGRSTGICCDEYGHGFPCSEGGGGGGSGGGGGGLPGFIDKWINEGPSPEDIEREKRENQAVDLCNNVCVPADNAGDFERAIDCYNQALSLNPNDAVVKKNLARINWIKAWKKANSYANEGNYQEALKYYQEARKFRYDKVIEDNIRSVENAIKEQKKEQKRKEDVAKEERIQINKNTEAEAKIKLSIDDLSREMVKSLPQPDANQLAFIDPGAVQVSGLTAGAGESTAPETEKWVSTAQLQEVQMHSTLAAQLKNEAASGEARIGFDTASDERKEGLPILRLRGIPPELRDPNVPEELQKDEEINNLVNQRTAARDQRHELEKKLVELEKAGKKDTPEFHETEQGIKEGKSKEVFLNFSIKEKIKSAREVKKEEAK